MEPLLLNPNIPRNIAIGLGIGAIALFIPEVANIAGQALCNIGPNSAENMSRCLFESSHSIIPAAQIMLATLGLLSSVTAAAGYYRYSHQT